MWQDLVDLQPCLGLSDFFFPMLISVPYRGCQVSVSPHPVPVGSVPTDAIRGSAAADPEPSRIRAGAEPPIRNTRKARVFH